MKENTNCTLIGFNAKADGCDGAFVFGDDRTATINNEAIVGTHLFGGEIPEFVQHQIRECPTAFEWVIKAIVHVAHDPLSAHQ